MPKKNNVMKASFVLYIDSLFILDELNNEQAGQLFKAIKAYHSNEDYELDFALNLVFMLFKNQFERDNQKYLNTCERNRNNGAKGGRPKKPKETEKTQVVLKKPKKADNDTDSDNDTDIIDFVGLLDFINDAFGRKFTVVSNAVKIKYKSLLTQGYKKEQIISAINNCKNDSFHKEKNYQYCTMEYFSRSATIDKYGDVSTKDTRLVMSHPTIID
jgi:hypothetical protein